MTPQELERELQTLEGFEQWLATQGAGMIIGSARNGCDCPLFKFLMQHINDRVQVASDGIAIGDGIAHHSRLSYEFIRQIDDGRRDNEPVTIAGARQALKAARRAIELGGQSE